MLWKDKIDRKPLILKGARQVGKTYILKEFGKSAFPRFHYLNFEKHPGFIKIFEENLDPARIVTAISFILDTAIDINKDLLIFDEIQVCPKALTSLKYFCEDMPALAVCAAGSLLGVELTAEAFPVGKIDELALHPLSYLEFLQGIGDHKSADYLSSLTTLTPIPEFIHTHLWDRFKQYLIIGGLPEVINTYRKHADDLYTALMSVRIKQNELLHAYFSDIAKHSGKQNALHIERLWRNIPAQLAKNQSGSAPKFQFSEAGPGISRYAKLAGPLDWLSKANLVLKSWIIESAQLPLPAYATENMFKLYLFDVGILGALCELPPKTILNYDYGTYKGYVAENFVAQELIAQGEKQLYSWRGKTSEIEFILEKEGKIIPLEVKSGEIINAKSLKVFIDHYRPSRSVILSARNVDSHSASHVIKLPLYLAGWLPRL